MTPGWARRWRRSSASFTRSRRCRSYTISSSRGLGWGPLSMLRKFYAPQLTPPVVSQFVQRCLCALDYRGIAAPGGPAVCLLGVIEFAAAGQQQPEVERAVGIPPLVGATVRGQGALEVPRLLQENPQ